MTNPAGIDKKLTPAAVDAELLPEDDALSVREVLAFLLRNRRRLVLTPMAVAVLVLGILLVWPRKYTTTVSFTPVTGATPVSQLSAIAAQYGLISGIAGAQTPAFYDDVIHTPDLLQKLALTRYEARMDGRNESGTIPALYGFDTTTTEGLADAIEFFTEKVLAVEVDNVTSLVSVSATTKWRDVSAAIAGRALSLVDSFNVQSHQQQADQQLRFLSDRVDRAENDLHTTETRLQNFLTRNRSFINDPALLFEHDRLQREVALRQQVYAMLVQAREQARVESARNTQSITVVQGPTPALRSDRRRALLKMILAAVFGFGVAVVMALIRERVGDGTRSQSASDLRALWQETRLDLRHPSRWLRRPKA
jgi:capsule polysaccharide export protein KpsE/RkpR